MTDFKLTKEIEFPKNLMYSLKRMDATFSKTKVKILADKTSAGPNDILRFRIPSNGIFDFRSLNVFFTASTSGNTTGIYLHIPRYSSAFINALNVSANSTSLSSINEYSYLYSKLMDLEGADYSQMSKRSTEMYDPSIRFIKGPAPENALTCVKTADSTAHATNDTGIKLCINNWLGFLGSLSTTCFDLSEIGDIYISIQTSPATILWKSFGANAAQTAATYNLTDIYMTIDRISFQSGEYYSQLAKKLDLDAGLEIGYYDYYLTTGSLTTKSNGVAMNFNVNSASLDQLIACFRRSDYNSICNLVLYGANTLVQGTTKSFAEVLSNPVAYSSSAGDAVNAALPVGLGDAFNNSIAYVSSANDLVSSSWSINSVSITPYALPPTEVYQNALQYTGYQNLDLGTSGLHPGCLSLEHFLRYYYVDICSLENISGDNNFWVSGYDGRQGGINVAYNAVFNTNAGQIFCYIYCRSTKVLTYKAGRQLEVDRPVSLM
jgi:hypothetical protein